MFRWSGAAPEEIGTVLDVGCGFGGTSRLLASKLPSASVKGITLSPEQVRRGTELAKEKGLGNVSFEVMDALKMDFPDNSFDMVWACESGEHMPDKKAYVDEMVRVLKPGGTIVIATWGQRETPPAFAPEEKQRLQFLYDEWSHPHFISIEEYVRLMEATGDLEVRKPTSVIALPLLPFAFVDTQAIDRSINRTSMSRVGPRLAQFNSTLRSPGRLTRHTSTRLRHHHVSLQSVGSANWNDQTIPSWRHSIWVGVWDPWIVVRKGPRVWYVDGHFALLPATTEAVQPSANIS